MSTLLEAPRAASTPVTPPAPLITSQLAAHFRGELKDIQWRAPSIHPQPDDLDLKDMARRALNYLRGNPEPARHYECKFSLGPLGIPCHVPLSPSNQYGFDPISLGDTDCRMDWQYERMREMVGEAQPDTVENAVRARVRSYQKGDHLIWVNPQAWTGEPVEGEWATTWGSAMLLGRLAETYSRTRNHDDLNQARAVFSSLKEIASWDGKRAFYPAGPTPWKNGEWLRGGWSEIHRRSYPFIVESCVLYYECCNDREALDFAVALTEGFMACNGPDKGTDQINPQTGEFRGQVHIHLHAVWGVASLGRVLREPRYLDWAERCYQWVLSRGTDYGWTPEFIPQPEYHAEVCGVGDMTFIAAELAHSGRVEYWDHVERIVRNMLRATQFSMTPEFIALFREVHKTKSAEEIEAALRELKRLEGGFVSQPSLNDWVAYPNTLGAAGLYANGIMMMGCCPPEGMRAVWEAWRGAVEERKEGVFVNTSLSGEYSAARIMASRPEDGRLDIEAHRGATYFLRPPNWVKRETVRLQRDGKNAAVTWSGPQNAYVVCDKIKPRHTLRLEYSVPVFTQSFVPQNVENRTENFEVKWIGNQVQSLSPRGKYLPMFS